MHKRTKACNFPAKTVKKIRERDGGCIFCQKLYYMPPEPQYIYDIMHIVNRSQGGLGIEENGVCGCRYHHSLLDNGNKGIRQKMLEIIEDYMKSLYPGWDRENLIYKKWNF